MSTKSKRYIVLASIAALFCASLFFFNHQQDNPAVFKNSATVMNVQFPNAQDDGSLRFFTGSRFISYQPKTDKTTYLSPIMSLASISKVRWSSTGVLFLSSGYSIDDDLHQALIRKNLDTDSTYWWRYDFKTQKVYLVENPKFEGRVIDAQWQNGSTDYMYVIDGGYVYNSNNSSQKVLEKAGIYAIPNANKHFISYLSSNNNGIYKYDLSTKKETLLTKEKVQTISEGNHNTHLAFTTLTDPNSTGVTPGKLFIINTHNNKTTKLSNNFPGNFIFSINHFIYWEYSDPDIKSLRIINTQTNKTLALHNENITSVLNVASSPNGNNIWISDENNNSTNYSLLPISKNDQNKTIKPNSNFILQGGLYMEKYDISYDEESNKYRVIIKKNPYREIQKEVLIYLQSQKINPDSINITWFAETSVIKDYPHIDNSVYDYGHSHGE